MKNLIAACRRFSSPQMPTSRYIGISVISKKM
jgi:hypothetical protein